MITSRRAFHFALRWGSSLAAVRGIGVRRVQWYRSVHDCEG